MRRILIFSGTTEGRRLAEVLSEAGVSAVVCVATEYGRQVMDQLPGITLHQGRMDREEMRAFMTQHEEELAGGFLAVVDATHPFATEVSENIRQSAGEQGLPYLRLQRDTKSYRDPGGKKGYDEQYFSTNEECAAALLETEGNVLLTTGSKELAAYCGREDLRKRLYVRVLPSEESIALCRKQGLAGRQIAAMQGPFSKEMNVALLRQYDIQYMVTKESGVTGGFAEKAAAAEELGICLYVIGNPELREGLSFGEVLEKVEMLTGVTFREMKPMSISLIGIGMGGVGTLTVEAKERIAAADYIFGAGRLLDCVKEWGVKGAEKKRYPYYLAEDIIPVLEEIYRDGKRQMPDGRKTEVAALFSGDSGFYSGSGKLYRKLEKWKAQYKEEIEIRICPGISSVAYFAAACGMEWQDARIMSIHGRGAEEGWRAEVISAVRYSPKVFLLVSGVEDVRAVGALLDENHLEDCRIILGYQLSYPEERITECTPIQCSQVWEKGLYILAVLNEKCETRRFSPQKCDEDFIRGSVPMTKEEIRELIICKLRLTEGAVVYDVGSGTGSVAVEIAGCSESIRVYAVEQKQEGIELIRKNQEKFGLLNIDIIHGAAPDSLSDLPVPTHAFIGGSGGRLKDILDTLYQKNPGMRVVMTAVTLETVSRITEIVSSMPVENEEIIQVQVSRAKMAGSSHLMRAENPVYICSFRFMMYPVVNTEESAG